jgi:hypothetical protein
MANHEEWAKAQEYSLYYETIDFDEIALDVRTLKNYEDGGWYFYLDKCPHRFKIKNQILEWDYPEIEKNLILIFQKHLKACAKQLKSASKGTKPKTKSKPVPKKKMKKAPSTSGLWTTLFPGVVTQAPAPRKPRKKATKVP